MQLSELLYGTDFWEFSNYGPYGDTATSYDKANTLSHLKKSRGIKIYVTQSKSCIVPLSADTSSRCPNIWKKNHHTERDTFNT